MIPIDHSVKVNRIPRLATTQPGDCTLGLGRGTGMSFKEFRQRLNAYMQRKGIANNEAQWRSRSRPAPRVCRIKKNDLWSQL